MINENIKLNNVRKLKAIYEFKTFIRGVNEWFRVYIEENVILEDARLSIDKETNQIDVDLSDCTTEFYYINVLYGYYAGADIDQLKKSYETQELMKAQDIAFKLIGDCISRGDWVNYNWEGAEYVDHNNIKVRCQSVELI